MKTKVYGVPYIDNNGKLRLRPIYFNIDNKYLFTKFVNKIKKVVVYEYM
jgi:hypothetical protein